MGPGVSTEAPFGYTAPCHAMPGTALPGRALPATPRQSRSPWRGVAADL